MGPPDAVTNFWPRKTSNVRGRMLAGVNVEVSTRPIRKARDMDHNSSRVFREYRSERRFSATCNSKQARDFSMDPDPVLSYSRL